jgi:hypothetical protein
MAQYMITYLGGDRPSSPEAGQAHMAKYKAWMGQLAEAIVSPANPLKDTHTIAADGSVTSGSSTAMSGYTVIEAQSIEQAIEMAKSCPFLDMNGSLEVSELIKMSM